jgi:hypothetical protein
MAPSKIRKASKVSLEAGAFLRLRSAGGFPRFAGCREFDACLALRAAVLFAYFRDIARFGYLCAVRRLPVFWAPELQWAFVDVLKITNVIQASEIIKAPGDF